MRMLKSVYGLSDAPLLWFREASRRLVKPGLVCERLDRCVFSKYNEDGEVIVLVLLNVDDLLIAGREGPELAEFIRELKKALDFGKSKKLTNTHPIMYCGAVLERDDLDITISLESYLKKIMPICIAKERSKEKPLSSTEVSKARGLLGAL